MTFTPSRAERAELREDLRDYVAHLQVHMALQFRNLVPPVSPQSQDSREQMLGQTQADLEKRISRQMLG
ncbi:MAG: hypothetical protein Q6J44_07250 [Gloeomargarita sp. DG02_4_bins_56]